MIYQQPKTSQTCKEIQREQKSSLAVWLKRPLAIHINSSFLFGTSPEKDADISEINYFF